MIVSYAMIKCWRHSARKHHHCDGIWILQTMKSALLLLISMIIRVFEKSQKQKKKKDSVWGSQFYFEI